MRSGIPSRKSPLKLVRRKETRKDIPPDLKAVKFLIEGTDDLSSLSDEELKAEKKRLMKLLKEEYDNDFEDTDKSGAGGA